MPLFVSVLAAIAVAAPTVTDYIERGHAAMDALEYEAAAEDFTAAAADPRATDAQRIDANLRAGICNRILGRDVEARLNFRYVLLKDIDAKLPAGSAPKIAHFFELVRNDIRATMPVAPAPAPSVTTTPDPAPPPVAPERSDEPGATGSVSDEGGGVSWPLLGGGIAVGALGALLMLSGGATVILGEFALATRSVPGQQKEWLTYGAFVGIGAMVVGVAIVVGGGALAAVGVVE